MTERYAYYGFGEHFDVEESNRIPRDYVDLGYIAHNVAVFRVVSKKESTEVPRYLAQLCTQSGVIVERLAFERFRDLADFFAESEVILRLMSGKRSL